MPARSLSTAYQAGGPYSLTVRMADYGGEEQGAEDGLPQQSQ